MTETIETDLPCALCGHNLKGLSPDANCPECGQPVARSFIPALQQSDPAWLRYQATTMLPLAALCLAQAHPYRDTLRYPAEGFLTVAATALGAWACWRLSMPDPAAIASDDREATLQRGLRLAVLLLTGIRLLGVLNTFVHPAAGLTAGLVAMACLFAAEVMVGLFLLRFARRAADPSLVRHARLVLWAFPLAQAAELLGPVLTAAVYREGDYGNRLSLFNNLITVVNYLLGAAVFAAALLMGRMHEVLRAAARLADARVTSSDAQPAGDSPVPANPPSATV
jgi:hypothetical protein